MFEKIHLVQRQLSWAKQHDIRAITAAALGGECPCAYDIFGFAAVAGARTKQRMVGTLTELPSRGVVSSPDPNICGCAVEAGAGTELTVGTLTELLSWRVVLSPDLDVCGCVVEAGAGTELMVDTLTELPSRRVVLSPDPDVCGCAVEAGAGTELTVGTLN
ncbi:hypothetical protein AAC387_Pa03g3890 [Persea americana]